MDGGEFLVIWEFRVRPGMESRFEAVYGPQGSWAKLFRTGDGFAGTELHRDAHISRRYFTLDFWTSERAYQRFRQQNAARYQAIDAECEAMTESEAEIGSFTLVGRAPGAA